MPHVRLILALHNHQPVGNFDSVCEEAYRTSYRPFLDVLERFPEIPFALHISGPLLEWLLDKHPEYIARVRDLRAAGRVEILGGAFYEPILTAIPFRDRVGQIREFSSYLTNLFATPIRGMWVPERVWEQHLVSAIARAGIEYTVLDDCLFQPAGCCGDDAFGYYLTEDEGHILKVFPAAETLRYSMPFQEPHATYEFLRKLAERRPGSTVVFADDGEKFGSWPKTYDHVYRHGWLESFCSMVKASSAWLEPTTFARTVDATLPLGKVSLPDGSYREMTEWALAPERLQAFRRAAQSQSELPEAAALAPFFRAGGSWRNFKARYPESDEMYSRMLAVSRRLEALRSNPEADPDYLEVARQELYRGQCNCPYWHGSFGGLYFPHLRNAIYRSLISADNALDDAQGLSGPRVWAEVRDFNLDGRQEVRLENDRLIALVRPALGGHIYELDVRHCATNLLATLERRFEAYHPAPQEPAPPQSEYPTIQRVAEPGPGGATSHQATARRFVYDTLPRKALVDHFLPIDVSCDDLKSGRPVERGDFATGTYLAKIQRQPQRIALVMERPGHADGHTIRIRKTIEMTAGDRLLTIHYELDDLPKDACVHFAVELNHAAMAGQAPDRYYTRFDGTRIGTLDSAIDAPQRRGLTLTDEWLDLRVQLAWSQPAGLWCFPIETACRSEGGFETIYQSSAVIPHWHVTADDQRHWDVTIRWSFDHVGSALAPADEQEDSLCGLEEGCP
jgi:4-alpha-glucanotransferase